MFSFISSRSHGGGGGRNSTNNKYQRVDTAGTVEEGEGRISSEAATSQIRRPSKPPTSSFSNINDISTAPEEGGDVVDTATTTSSNIKNNNNNNNNNNNYRIPRVENSTTTIGRLFMLARPERKLIILSAITMAIGSSVSLSVPTFSGKIIDLSIGSSSSINHDDPTQQGTDEGDQSSSSAFTLLLQLLSIMTVSGCLGFFRILWQAKAGHYVVARIRRQLYAGMLSQDAAYYDSMKQGDLLSRLSSDSDLIQSAVTDQALGLLRNIVIAVGAVLLLFYTSISLALVSVSILPPIAICARLVGRKMKDRQTKVRELHAEATSLAEQALTCIKTVQQFVSEDYESQKYNLAINTAHYEAIQTAKLKAIFGSVMGLTVNLALLCVLGYGGLLVSRGTLSPGDLASFVMYSVMMGSNISGISTQYIDLMKAVAAANRVFEIIDRQPSIPSPQIIINEYDGLLSKQQQQHQSLAFPNKERTMQNIDVTTRTTTSSLDEEDDSFEMVEVGIPASNKISNSNNNHHHQQQQHKGIVKPTTTKQMPVEFQQVSFAYPSRPDSLVLENLNLSIEAGQMIALVGGSGGGKSTIASLLTRLYDPCSGKITLNDIPIDQMDPQDLRRQIGIVVQEPLLFPTTIEDNIRYGSPNATYEEIHEAAKLAFVLDFTDQFPDGLQTVVGPRGTQLSGGQKQRVAVARCILKNPPVLLFDEATSALDAQSESAVQKAIDIAAKGRTVIMIAHRLSTIRNVDKIAVLKNGNVVEFGSFDDLVTKPQQSDENNGTASYFRQLMDKQLLVQ